MKKILSQKFYTRNTLRVARSLLGKNLVLCGSDGVRREALIVEVEAYHGQKDRASHASRGKTERNAPMFGLAGRWYVYLVYGMHWMLNVTTLPKGKPGAVLIRGVLGASGPGKVTKQFGIDRRYNGQRSSRKTKLWIEDSGIKVLRREIIETPRIGVDYAGVWTKKPWRFVWKSGLEAKQ